MGRRHAVAASGIATAQVDEQLREAEARRASAERERQLLTSYLGTQEQVAGTGRFNVNPEVVKYTQRYNVDQRALAEILQAGSQVKRQEDPFQGADNRVRGGLSIADYGQGFANRANDLLAQAEAAARVGDLNTAERLYTQAQSIIGGVSQVAQGAYNLGGGEETAAAVGASSTEARIVGRQLLAARELQDPNSATSAGLRGRLLDPSLAAIDQGAQSALGEIAQGEQSALRSIDEGTGRSIGQIDASERDAQQVIDQNIRNAERAIAAERGQIEGQIRQRAAAGGTGVNARAQLALQSRAGSEAARSRAEVYTNAAAQAANVRSEAGRLRSSIYDDEATQRAAIQSDAALRRAQVFTMQGAQRAALTAQVSVYINDFTKRLAEDAVRLSQEWVNGTANVRDEFQLALDRFSMIGIQMANERALIAQQIAEQRRAESKGKSDFLSGALLGGAGELFGGLFGELLPKKKPSTEGQNQGDGDQGDSGASQILGLVGTGVGAYFGGPAGAAIGGNAGSQLGSLFG